MEHMKAKPKKSARIFLRLEPTLDQTLRDFCKATARQPVHTIREIIRLFFAEGAQAAERRLSSGLWGVSTPADAAEAAVRDARSRRRSRPARAVKPTG